MSSVAMLLSCATFAQSSFGPNTRNDHENNPGVLLSTDDRKVRDPQPGANYSGTLAPGVHSDRKGQQATSLKPETVRKTVITG